MSGLITMMVVILAPVVASAGILSLLGDPPSAPDAPSVTVHFGPNGITSLKFSGTEFLQSDDTVINSAEFESATGATIYGGLSHTTSIDLLSGTVTQSYPWGVLHCQFVPAGGRLHLKIAIENTSGNTLRNFVLGLPTLKFPAKPAEYDDATPVLAHTVGELGVVMMSYGSGTLALTIDDPTLPLMAGFPWAYDRPASTIFPLLVNTGRNSSYPSSLPEITRPLPAGGTLEFTVTLRFGPAGATVATLAPDLYQQFATAFPYRLKWDDRRSIGSLFLSTAATGWKTNPRGWFNDANIDVTTPIGLAAFKSQLLAYADRSIAILKKMNSQGMITWDLEGEEFPHATTYIGDPRFAETLAPELNGVIDQYFQKFRDAGLKVGVTIRPQQFVLSADHKNALQQEVADPAQTLIDKITHAKNRWGATLFYIDSNGDPSDPTDAALIERVAAAFPDVLLIPESQNLRYYATTAPYDELRRGVAATPAGATAVYSNAFSVINIADSSVSAQHDALLSAVKRGDILMYHAWFDDADNANVRRLYDEAGLP